MTIQQFGSSALLVNFEQKIDLQINQKVLNLYHQIKNLNWEEITFLIPAYCSLTVGFDLNKVSVAELKDRIDKLSSSLSKNDDNNHRSLIIPVCYNEEFGLDLFEIEQLTGFSAEKIIDLHTSMTYRVYMLGFLPGFPYMGILPELLHTKRKEKPRLKVPKGSVGIAGAQTGIYPTDAPGGWQIIGKTPSNIFDGTKKNPFVFQPGDEVKFQAIDEMTFKEIEKKVSEGTFNEHTIYV